MFVSQKETSESPKQKSQSLIPGSQVAAFVSAFFVKQQDELKGG